MKRLILITVLLLVVLAVFGCDDKEEMEITPEYTVFAETEGNIDLDDFNFKYTIVPDPYGYGEDGAPFGYLINSAFSDAALKRVHALEDKMNFTMEFAYTTQGTLEGLSVGSTYAASYYTDACDVEDAGIKNMTIALVPISGLSEFIDIYNSAKWGTPGILETVMLDGELYAVHPELWPERFVSFASPVIFNSDIVTAAGQPDPRELLEGDKWNRSSFEQLIKDCTVYEGGEVKYYGMGVHSSYMFELGVRTNGSYFMEKQGDKYVYSLDTDRALRGMQWIYDMIVNNPDCFLNGAAAASRETYLNPFLEGQTAMFMHPTWALFTVVGMKVENWGLMPFPNGPDNEDGEWTGFLAGNRNFVGILNTSRDIEASAIILSALYEPLDEYPTQESLIDYYDNYMFHDHRDTEVYFTMQNNSRYNYWFEGGYMVSDTIAEVLGQKSVKQIVEEKAAAFQTLIDDRAAPNQALYEDLVANGK